MASFLQEGEILLGLAAHEFEVGDKVGVEADDVGLLFLSFAVVSVVKFKGTANMFVFCFAYLFRWFGVTTQSYFSAIEKPLQATIISVGTAFVFPVVLLGALWSFGLDGIWFNFVGVNALTTVLSAFLLGRLMKEIDKREKELTTETE